MEDDIRRSGISIIKYRLTYLPVGLEGCVLEVFRLSGFSDDVGIGVPQRSKAGFETT